ncbi:hypothetical protein Hanom_Chr10g00912091 [Helianthus anomalus]
MLVNAGYPEVAVSYLGGLIFSVQRRAYGRMFLILCLLGMCRIGLRPKRVVRKSSNPFQRRKQRNGRVHSLNHTLNLLYIDFTAFTVTRNTGNTSVSNLESLQIK